MNSKLLRCVGIFTLITLWACDESHKAKEDPPDDGEAIYPQDTMICTQPFKNLALNNWNILGTTQGSWGFYDYKNINGDGRIGGEFPRGSGNTIIYAGGLMIGATKEGVASVSSTTFSNPEFEPGRIKNSVPAPIDSLRYTDSTSGCLYVIDNTRSDYDWTWWPIVYGAPATPYASPLLISDRDSWTIFHDAKLSNHGRWYDNTNPRLGIEVREQTYSFNVAVLGDVFFVRWNVKNHSTIGYNDLHIALWSDIDVAGSDRVGSDTSLSLVYVYNPYSDFPSTPKAIGCELLYASGQSNPIPASMIWSRKNGDEGISDDKLFNLIKGLDRDGSPRLYGTRTKPQFDFPGDPVTGIGPNMTSNSDVRILISAGPFIIGPGETREVVFAVIGSTGTDRLDAITQLKSKAVTIRNAFDILIKPDLDLH